MHHLRCLHTADWHLGAELKGQSRLDEQDRFLDWLLALLDSEKIDVLLVAGDVFEHAHPSAKAQALYYRFLARLPERLRATVIIAGNHDSAQRLEAPRELLHALRIHVVGTLANQRSENLVRVDHRLVIAALPFVHEYRLGVRIAGQSAAASQEATRAAFTSVFEELADAAEAMEPDAALVALAHLPCTTLANPSIEKQYRSVYLQGALPCKIFDHRFCYVALGHLHQAHSPDGHRVHYPGSPIRLNLSELEHSPRVLCFDVGGGELLGEGVRSIEPPTFRKLLRLKGNREQLRTAMQSLSWADEQAPIVYLQADDGDEHAVLRELDEFRRTHCPELTIAAVSIPKAATPPTQTNPLDTSEPREVFRQLYRLKHPPRPDLDQERQQEDEQRLMALFDELLGST